MLTPVILLVTKSEKVDTGTTFKAGSDTLGLANYFASATKEINASAEPLEFPPQFSVMTR